jgi:hypothetical protein
MAKIFSVYESLEKKLNHEWHEIGLKVFMFIVLAHWAEHLIQAFQIFVLAWPREKSFGLIGQWYPWMIQSELLHYAYALIMLAGIWIFRSGFKGRSLLWWNICLGIQAWHHVEHLLLQLQAVFHYNLFNSAVPISIMQLFIPRVELHLFYNSVVFVPMIIAMYFHLLPSAKEHSQQTCSCAWFPAKAS